MKTAFFDIDNWKEIGATLSRNKTRTFLTGFGIFWGVAILAILMGGARGVRDMISRNFSGFTSNSAMIMPHSTTIPYRGFEKGRIWSLTLHDTDLLREAFPQITALTQIDNQQSISLSYANRSIAGTVASIDADYNKVLLPKIYAGRSINEADVATSRKVVALGKQLADQLFPTDPNPVGKEITIGGIVYTVVGIVGQTNEVQINGKIDQQALIPSSTFRRAYNRGDKVAAFILVVDDNTRVSTLMPAIRRLLSNAHSIHPDDQQAIDVFDISEMFETVNGLFTGLNILALFIGLSTLLAGVIGIGNIMWVIVKERTHEIGIRRAIGATPRDIIFQILSEGMVLTTIAGMAGISFAVFLLGITQHITTDPTGTPHFQMSLIQAIEIFLTFALLGMAAGLIPARKAMKIKPVEAINDK